MQPIDQSGLSGLPGLADMPEDFGFTRDHELLMATARRMLAQKCPMAEVRRLSINATGDATGYDPRLFAELCEHGWAGMLVPEAHGGAGLDHLSMALILAETGRVLLPAPLFGTVLAGIALTLAGSHEQKERWLRDLAAGTRIGTVGLTEPGGSWEPDAVSASAHEVKDGYVLGGIKNHVLFGRSAHLMIAPFRLDSGDIALFAVDLATPGVRIEDETGVDATRRMARVILAEARVHARARLAAGDLAAWRRTHVAGYALIAAEMVGAADAMLVRTRDYALERIQFGRPIGSFQAVKHPLVDVLIAVESARSLVVGAAAALDAEPESAETLARMAKAQATHALGFAVDRGVQLHGGFGFTWDCDAHLYFKRSLWSAATLGDATHHRRHLANTLLA